MSQPSSDETSVEARVRAALDELGVTYEVLPCDPDLADTADFAAHYGYPLERSANAIVVASRTEPRQHVVCVVLATTRLDVNRTVRKRMGVRKASFAPAEETAELTGMAIGGVTPLALPAGLPVWVDARVLDHDWVIVGGGSRSCKIKVSPEVFRRLPDAEIVEDLAAPG